MSEVLKHDHDLRARIGARVAEAGLSYAEIAHRSGVHPSQVSRICRGEFKTGSANVSKICTVLGIRSEEVFNRKGTLDERLAAAMTACSCEEINRIIDLLIVLRNLKRDGHVPDGSKGEIFASDHPDP